MYKPTDIKEFLEAMRRDEKVIILEGKALKQLSELSLCYQEDPLWEHTKGVLAYLGACAVGVGIVTITGLTGGFGTPIAVSSAAYALDTIGIGTTLAGAGLTTKGVFDYSKAFKSKKEWEAEKQRIFNKYNYFDYDKVVKFIGKYDAEESNSSLRFSHKYIGK